VKKTTLRMIYESKMVYASSENTIEGFGIESNY